VLIFGSPMGPLAQLGLLLPHDANCIYAELLARAGFVVSSWGFIFLCLELKSFVFNIYHVLMTMISFNVQFGDKSIT
jgi:hypothetical protein